MRLPAIGSPAPELECSCGAKFVGTVEHVQEMRDHEGALFCILGYASHDPRACAHSLAGGVNGTRCWEIWSADEAAPKFVLWDEVAGDEPLDLDDFFGANAEDEQIAEMEAHIRALPVGGEVRFGGGAQPLTAVRRVS